MPNWSAMDDYSDLAVIRVDPAHAPLVPVYTGRQQQLQVGQRVIAIGNPFGLDGSMTVGIVSALGRTLPSAQLLDPTYQPYSNPSIIQIDAAVNPGNSGGPLLDSYGRWSASTRRSAPKRHFRGDRVCRPGQHRSSGSCHRSSAAAGAVFVARHFQPATSTNGLSVAALADQLGFPVRNGVLISEVDAGFAGGPGRAARGNGSRLCARC